MGDEHNALSRSEPLGPTKKNDLTHSINEERSPIDESIELHEFAGSQSYGSFVYREDVVKLNQNESLLGIVQVVAGDMASDSDTDEDDDDEEEDDDDDDDDGNDDDGDEEEEGGEDDRGAGHEGNDDEGEEAGDADEGGDNSNSALKDGQVSVIWLDNSETTNSLNEVTVVDRGFLHGDIVAAVTDPTGQLGVVMDVDISVDLQSADNLIIKEVSSKSLHRVRDLAVGDYVVHGPWLGRVDDVLDNVTVLFDDGSYCKVLKADHSLLKPVSKNILADESFPYHPGQRVRATSSSVFKKARWFCGAWKANRLEGTIVKVQAGSVFVYWIASANPGSVSGSVTVPHEEQKPKDLTLLSCLLHSNWQLGDWCLPPTHLLKGLLKSVGSTSHLQGSNKSNGCNDITDPVIVDSEETIPDSNLHGNDRTMLSNTSRESGSSSNLASVLKENVHEREAVHCKKNRKVVIRRDKKPRKRGEIFDRGFQIVSIRTKVDVAWQDGTREFRRDSMTLIPIDSPGDHEFCAEQYVVEKASDEGEDSNEVKRVGVVKSVSAKDRTACVRWLKPVARPEDLREFANEEVVSVYELEEHPDYDYCYGDIVIRLSPLPMIVETPSSGNADEGQNQQPGSILANGDQKSREVSENCNQTCTDEPDVTFSSVSWVGNITGFEDGDIQVTWADGMVSKVGPQAIYVVVRDDDPESEISDTDAASWETFDGSEDADEDKEEDASLQNTNSNKSQMEESTLALPEGNNSGRSGPLAIPLAALGFVTRLASGLFTRRGNGSLSVPFLHSDSKNANESEDSDSERGASDEELSSHQSDVLNDHLARTTHETREGCGAATGAEPNMVENVESLECYEDDLCSFKHFDIAKEPWDHYYLGGSGSNITGGRKWVKKIQQDWSILEKNLPSEIFVRVYEDRMDLLRAVIVGAFGTPYQDGLFFFDFQLPPEYPQVPPSAYYHSGGLRVNPNLYEDGKVCLSLLNTWNGKGNEVWDPSSSSILQVLVSLQGLVLNSKPYFNEAGYDKQVGTAEGEKNSLSYNENTFLLNCKSILYVLRRPPKHFEEFVKRHFRRRGYYILKACDEYMKGGLVGSLTKDACKSDRSGQDSNSVGFKLMLGKIVPRLISALSEVGADCDHFKHLQQT